MISKDTAALIWTAYREIDAAEKLLSDMKSERSREGLDRFAPSLRDAFGRVRHLQLGIPTGESGHRLLDVSPVLAEGMIRAHMADKRSELVALNEIARTELDAPTAEVKC